VSIGADRLPLLALVEQADRALVADLVSAAAERGFPEIRVSHNAVFATLEPDGSRVSEMAARAGITKQSLAAIVKDLERAGLVAVSPDPADGRAKVVKYTDRGLQCARGGAGYLREVEDNLATVIGRDRLDDLRQLLDQTARHFETRLAQREQARPPEPRNETAGARKSAPSP
jgi:DNA-binding MarR family transcriptional regulator